MALNLVRNSKVFFTTNVNAATGIINSSGFLNTNTYEIQVLDGFTFSQGTNQETVTISEAGSDPIRGQRAFNTSLNPVDFSMSTYLRPALLSNVVAAEESVLWNALLSSSAVDSTGTTLGGTPTAAYTFNTATGKGSLALTVLSLAAAPTVNSYVTITGLIHADTLGEVKYLNAPAKVISSSTTAVTLEYANPYPGTITGITFSAGAKLYTSTGWAPNGTTFAVASTASSNKNQLQKFGMLFLVDNVLYGVDNAAMTQVSIDFGIDAIATAAWTGQGTVLRKLADGAVIASGTITALTESLGAATISAASGTNPATATITLTTAIASNISTGQTVTGTGTPGVIGSSSTVVSVTRNTSGLVTSFTITGTSAHTNGALTGVTVTTLASGSYAQKNTSAAYLTNKISTVSLKLVNDLKDASNNTVAVKDTSYSIALTGGSFTFNNNVTYLTPANLSVVNLPIANFTGARAISGSMNAYLKTGVGEGGTGQLLNDLLAAASTTIEPMFALKLNIGGSVNNRVELDMPGAMLTIPTVDVQQVVSTTINFMGQAMTPSTTTGSTYALDKLNDVIVRYYAV